MGQNLAGYQIVTWLGEGLYVGVKGTGQTVGGSDIPALFRVLPAQVVPLPAPGSPDSGASPSRTAEPTHRRIVAALRAAHDATKGVGVLPLAESSGGVLPDGRPYYIMAWNRDSGHETLQNRLARAPRSLTESLEIVVALCHAVESACAAHYPPVQLSPDTVLLRLAPDKRGISAHLLDLGLITHPGASERPGQSDPRADVYAVGSILYQLATGSPLDITTAFAGPGADLPPDFQAVTLRALAQRVEDRYPSLAAFRKDLSMLLSDARRAPGRRGQRTLSVLVGGVVVLALVASGILLFSPSYLQPVPAPVAAPPSAAPPPRDHRAPSPPPAEPARAPAAAPLMPLALQAKALALVGEMQQSADPRERIQAATLIGQSQSAALRMQAEGLLADIDPLVAAKAAWALGQLGDRASVVALGQASSDPQIALEAGIALVRLGELRGLNLLRQVLRAPEGRGAGHARDEARLEAALWLGEHGEQDAWRTLRRFLNQTQDNEPLQHLHILGRLCQGRDQAACQQLRDRLDPAMNGQAKLLVGLGLMQAGDLLGVKILRECAAVPALQLQALRHLAQVGLQAEEERWLIQVLANGSGKSTPEMRVRAAEALGIAAVEEAVPALGQAIGDAPGPVQRAAAAALLRIAGLEDTALGRRALNWALAGIHDGRVTIRAAAAAVLGSGPAELVIPLLQRAAVDREVAVRLAAARALGQIDSGAAVGVLAQIVADRDGAVRVAALQALGRMKHAGDTLRTRLTQGSLQEQVVIAGALLASGDASHRFVFQQALQSPDVQTRRQVVEELQRDPDTAQRLLLLAQALADPADEVQSLAAVALAREGDRRGVETLKRQASLLLLPQRLLARDALARLKEPVTGLDLMAAVSAAGEGQRAAAMLVIPRLQDETAEALLLLGLHDVAPAVRLAALAALEEAPPRRVRHFALLLFRDPEAAVQARAMALLSRALKK